MIITFSADSSEPMKLTEEQFKTIKGNLCGIWSGADVVNHEHTDRIELVLDPIPGNHMAMRHTIEPDGSISRTELANLSDGSGNYDWMPT